MTKTRLKGGDEMKCIVCGKEGAVEIHIVDGYMAGGKFNTCPTSCYREIVSKGVAFWKEKEKSGGHK